MWGPVSGNRTSTDKIKKGPPSLQQQSGTVRKFPYRYFMERKSFDAPSLFWSELKWKKKEKSRGGKAEEEG